MTERTRAFLAHAGFAPGCVAPLLGVLWAWAALRAARRASHASQQHAAQALNFQLTMLLLSIVSWSLVFSYVGVPMLLATVALNAAGGAMACVHALRGRSVRYPLSLRLIALPLQPTRPEVDR